MPVLIGSAEARPWRHAAAEGAAPRSAGHCAARAGSASPTDGPPLAHAIRTIHTAHGGKLTFARVLRGSFADGTIVTSSRGGEDRIAGLSRLMGATGSKQPKVEEGDTLAFGRLEPGRDRRLLRRGQERRPARPRPRRRAPPPPVHALSLERQGSQGRGPARRRARPS